MTSGKLTYRLAAMGDVMLAREVGRHFKERPEDFSFNEIKLVLNGHDLICLNLENPVGINGTPDKVQDPHVTFCAHPDTLKALKSLGATVVSLGNNHMLDYGENALEETLEYLNAAGIKYAGAGRNYEEANRPLLLECNGKKIAFLSHVFIYSASTLMAKRDRAGVSDHRIRKILPRIKELSRQGYHVIVSIHWGWEYSFYPIPYQMKQARQMIDNGALLILGHGPHYPQGIEDYKDGRIVYSLGNFIFDEPQKYARRSFIYSVGVTEDMRLEGAKVLPVHINHIPKLAEGKEKEHLERLIYSMGKAYHKRDRRFWKKINNGYFRDIIGRIMRMKSLKFAFLPPPSFYLSIGFRNFIKKLNFAAMKSVLR